jgi:hypothetical protein
LLQIVRVRNLLKITAGPAARVNPPERECHVDVEVLRMKDDHDRVGEAVGLDPNLTFRVGDIIGLRVENQGTAPLDVTMLWIDGNYGITAIFPDPDRPGQDNRVRPGEPVLTLCEIVEKSLGREHVVVIAVAPHDLEDRADFSFLAARTFAEAERGLKTRGGPHAASATLESPLGRLMQSTIFARGDSRGIRMAETKEYSMHVRSWNSRPRTSGAGGR